MESAPRPPLPEGPFLVVGLARSGVALAEVLAGRGERVAGCDSGHPGGAERLSGLGVEVSLDVDGTELLDGAATVVKSPGVPQDAAVIGAARERGITVLGELELSWRLLPNPFVAVTGTNGKTTVTELLGHVLREAGRDVAVAGNVGTPLAALVGEVDAAAEVVCECSSFQLEDTESFRPDCAVLLNVTPDHIDRHRTLDAYGRAKLRAFANQGPEDVAVWDADDPGLSGLEIPGRGRREPYCDETSQTACAVTLRDGAIEAGSDRVLAGAALPIPGAHNVRNAMAATAAALARGLGPGEIGSGLRTFAGVPHRLERVAEIAGVTYVNDSKATNVAAAAAALSAFDAPVRPILGGSLKGSGFGELGALVAEHCPAAYLIGEAAGRLAADLAPVRAHGVELRDCGDLSAAVATAAADAVPGDVVLLAPACASFDAFRDYEERGERFRELVEGLR